MARWSMEGRGYVVLTHLLSQRSGSLCRTKDPKRKAVVSLSGTVYCNAPKSRETVGTP